MNWLDEKECLHFSQGFSSLYLSLHEFNSTPILKMPATKTRRKNRKHFDTSWDFKSEDTKQYTHCFHRYPAQMIPQVARRLIETYGRKDDVLFDPYCGSGTSLVEGLLFGMDVYGCDINPLAVTISRAKTDKTSKILLRGEIEKLSDILLPFNIPMIEETVQPKLPQITNIDYWFPKSSQMGLGVLRTLIDKVKNRAIRNFFTIAFSETVRECSYTRPGEFKLFRIPQEKLKIFNRNVYSIFLKKVERNFKGYSEFLDKRSGKHCSVYLHNSVQTLPSKMPEYQLVVTSPPYGDSRTTVAYGQYATLSLEWLGYEQARKLDSQMMGGFSKNGETLSHSPTLKKILKQITANDDKRSDEVLSFFIDLFHSIANVSMGLKKNGVACYVVGNRTVKGINIPMDDIVVEFFENCGLVHYETAVRNIPNKAMPSMNSPSNKSGVLERTMTKEYVVIMKKGTTQS